MQLKVKKDFAISWSRLQTHEKCPLLSYYTNFAPKKDRLTFDETSPPLVKGRLWHKWMEDSCAIGKELPFEVSHMQRMVEAIRRPGGKLFVEKELALSDNYKEVSWFSKDAYWRTIFDILKVFASGTAFSIDWKTGKVSESTDQLRYSSAAAMLKHPAVHTIKTSYVWLEHPHTPPTTMNYHRDELDGIVEEFEERVDVVKLAVETDDWQPNPSPFSCKWCRVSKAQCRYSKNP